MERKKPGMLHYEMGTDVVAFSTQRDGGCSTGNYGTFNANWYCGDNEECVAQNRELLAQALQVRSEDLFVPHQTHGIRVECIKQDWIGMPERDVRKRLEDVDAIVTDVSGLCICVSTADCIPILLYDEKYSAVAAIHAGWRGTVQNIVGHTIAFMKQVYGTCPENVRACIGPGISLDAFEVGDEVYQKFQDSGFNMDVMAVQYPDSVVRGKTKWHLDLWEANRLLLVSSGIPETQIQVAGICTYKEYKRFFSARRLGIRSGRILNGIMLKK